MAGRRRRCGCRRGRRQPRHGRLAESRPALPPPSGARAIDRAAIKTAAMAQMVARTDFSDARAAGRFQTYLYLPLALSYPAAALTIFIMLTFQKFARAGAWLVLLLVTA